MMLISTDVRTPQENNIMKVLKLRWRCLLFLLAVASLIFLLYYTVHWPRYGYDCQGPYWKEGYMKHLDRYCNPITEPVRGEEGDVPTDDKYQLQSVHMLIRHGDRYSMHSLPNYENAKISCIISEDLKQQVPVMKNYQTTMEGLAETGGRSAKQTFHGYNLYPNRQTCSTAQLTPTGATQHVLNGQFLKSKYIDKWKLLDKSKVWEEVLVRSTKYYRTFESSLALMYGFLPEFGIGNLNIEETLLNSMCTQDSGMACDCSSIEEYMDVFSPNYKQRSPHLMAEPKLRDAYAQISDVLGVASNSLPVPSRIYDVNMIHFCHQLPLPNHNGQCEQPWSMSNIFDKVNENGQNQVTNSNYQKLVRVKFQPLFHEMVRRMEKQLKGESSLKFILYSGHDSTIEPFAAALGFSSGIWARYASRIVIELYSDKNQNTAFIRVLYNGKLVTNKIQFCKDHIADTKLGLCPLEKFIEFADGGNIKDLKEDSYEQACEKTIPYR